MNTNPNKTDSTPQGETTDEGRKSKDETRVRRLPKEELKPRNGMTFREQQQAQRDHQAGIVLEAEIRRLAREHGLDIAAAHQLAESARVGFRIVNGEPIPVAGDRQTVLLAADGVNVLSVAQWVARRTKEQPRDKDGRFDTSPNPLPGRGGEGATSDDELLPQRNPFRRKTWNLTEQMRLQRRDPKLARRLKAEAYANGEN
jgi:hypothetical protein